MKRNVSMEEISDGNLYELNDLVKAGCGGCQGCSTCCRGMGQSIVLDPLDIHRLVCGLKQSIEVLLGSKIELNVVDGIVLPNLMQSGDDEACGFLDDNGRCSIHGIRPGICRLFPLGRYYENGGFKYFLQVNECPNPNRVKVKVKKWIDTPQIKENQQFVTDWHYFLNDVEALVSNGDEAFNKKVVMYVLQQFYLAPFKEEEDFYEQFNKRLEEARVRLGLQ